MTETNWAGNQTYQAVALHHPRSVDEVRELLRRRPTLKVLGSRHSFNDIADTTGDHISLDQLPRVLEVDTEASTVTVDGGTRYGDLCGRLDMAGYALHNLASLPHISVAGACATATHGSGDLSRNLAAAVSAMEIVTGGGDVVTFSRAETPDELAGAVVSLGALGVVTRLTLDVSPTFRMQQDVYEDLPLATVRDRFEEIFASSDSVSLFTTWRTPAFEQVWFKRRLDGDTAIEMEPELFGARRATRAIHPIAELSAIPCTEQLGVPGPWHERMPHFRMEHTPSSGAELQTEYFVARQHATDAIDAVFGIASRFADVLMISEVRSIAADELWLSPCYRQPSVSLHFTWVPDWARVLPLLPVVEEALAPFEPRPHWGKVFTMPPDVLRSRYERLPAFRALVEQHDPAGQFRNAFLERYLFADA